MEKKPKRPAIGVGVYIFNARGEVLLGLRKGDHAPDTWCPPGGHLEMGETPEQTAVRETFEEAGINISDIKELGFTNDLFEDGRHYITIQLTALYASGDVRVMELDKCKQWKWFAPDCLPSPLMLSVRNAVQKHGILR